jgi:protein tyrosine/serine phosphatase
MRESILLITEGVENLGMLKWHLYRSGQPVKWDTIKKMGIKRVINLREENPEKKILAKLGIVSVHYPFHPADKIEQSDLVKVAEMMDEEVSTLVHCLHGMDRTGLVCFCYRVLRQNWDYEDALEEMRRFICTEPIDQEVLEAAKKFYTAKKLGRIK